MGTLDFDISSEDWVQICDGSVAVAIEHVGGDNGILRASEDKPDNSINRGHILASGRVWNSDIKAWAKCKVHGGEMYLVVTPGGS